MFVKNLLLNLFLLDSTVILMIIMLVNSSIFFLFLDLRYKLFMFLVVSCFFSFWGFFFNLDGLFLIFLLTEFTIFLLFLMTYIQLYSNLTFFWKYSKNYLLFNIFIIFITSINKFIFNTLTSNSYYSNICHIVSSDFFMLYYFFFNNIFIVIILLTLIISLFSLYFIILYFSIKQLKYTYFKKNIQLYSLRKQNLLKQNFFINKVYIFQN